MGITVIKSNVYKTGVVHDRSEVFVLDSEADLALLPADTHPGSIAWLADMSASFELSLSGEWMESKIVEGSGGVSGGSAGGGSGSHKFIIRLFSMGSSGLFPAATFKYQDIKDAFQTEHDLMWGDHGFEDSDEGWEKYQEWVKNAIKPMDFQLITTKGGDPLYGPNNGKSPVGECSYEVALAVRWEYGGNSDMGIQGAHFFITFPFFGDIVITENDELLEFPKEQ